MVKKVLVQFIGEEISNMITFATKNPIKSDKYATEKYFRMIDDNNNNKASISMTFFPDEEDNMHYHFSIRTPNTTLLFLILIELFRRIGCKVHSFGMSEKFTYHIYWKSIETEELNANDFGNRSLDI